MYKSMYAYAAALEAAALSVFMVLLRACLKYGEHKNISFKAGENQEILCPDAVISQDVGGTY
jgi:hypothetical protein